MLEKYLPYNHSFNEELTAEKLFEIKEASSIINYNIRNNTLVQIYYMIAKYLLHIKKIVPLKVREILRKYAVLISYLYLTSCKEVKIKSLESKKLKDILNDVSLSNLDSDINEEGLFANLYNDKEYYSSLNKLIKEVKKYNPKAATNIYKALRFEFNYFAPSTDVLKFNLNKSMKRFDMIISEALLDKEFYNFTFKLDFESFKANLVLEEMDNLDLRLAYTYVGFIIHDIFLNENFKFKKKINFIPNKLLVLSLFNKDTKGLKKINFIKEENKEYFINWSSSFKDFDFEYNGQAARFCYKHIKISTK